ncbi:PEP/pyruvate-binding domain-containing protein [Thermodesulforhabdus norvegica]|uniref:Pyruvate phosphate dikinase n=1 Tax=Thermodesulforhabdus norvegica TaxID=39841 RepID=A0A1I4VJL4_9BACT|nr:PEP/pyruvate-binding domain-containing protein [Thermodesulforhabdus norvegica]SFN01323.1 pyruvate phosphate dikinase [Thermodesulforhabdus norvegica]
MQLSREPVNSQALKIHLELTRSVPVKIKPVFMILKEVVSGFRGKEAEAEELLQEYHHKYANWQVVVDEAWRYTVSNISLIEKHPLRGRIVFLIALMLWDSFVNSLRADTKAHAMDRFLAFWLKMLERFGSDFGRPVPDKAPEIASLDLHVEQLDEIHEGILRHFLIKLVNLDEENFEYLLRSYYSVKSLANSLLKVWHSDSSFVELRSLMNRIFKTTYDLWLSVEDPCKWLTRTCDGVGKEFLARSLEHCSPISHKSFSRHRTQLETIAEIDNPREAVVKLLELPDHRDIVKYYSKLPDMLKLHSDDGLGRRLSMLMRLKILQTPGLESIHEETLRSINQELSRWLKDQKNDDLYESVDMLLTALEEAVAAHPKATLQCLHTIGLEIVKSGNKQLIDSFIERLISMGFQTARVQGVSDYWQVKVNEAHLLNIRVWLDLIKQDPQKMRNLLSALIVYLSLTGTCIRDTDLFQRDISELLHAPIAPVYNLVKQLAKLFPVYFNEIGAEGLLRNVSTEVDEIYGRGDPLIHFLRKQSHVESNNLTVPFIENIFRFWITLNKEHIKPFLPAHIYEQIDPDHAFVQGPHRLLKALQDNDLLYDVEDLLEASSEKVESVFNSVSDVTDAEKKRTGLMIRFYQLLKEKYALSAKDIREHLNRGAQLGLPDPSAVLKALDGNDPIEKLEAILDYLRKLQEIILKPSKMEIQENIYLKRHIAVDIPSMYGSYHEKKFDALGLTFRLENLANLLFEEIIQSIDLSFITRATFSRIVKFIPLFLKALNLEGIHSVQLQRYQELFEKALQIRRFTHSQFMDIFRGFSESINQIIHTYYHVIHEPNLNLAIKKLKDDEYLPKFARIVECANPAEKIQMISETFLRDLVARTFGLQYFDNFVTNIVVTLSHQKATFVGEDLDLLLSYEPEKTISWIYDPTPQTFDLIHLGNKGYNLAVLHSAGINVPPGFIITTEYFRCRRVVDRFPESRKDFEARVMSFMHRLEKETGRCFGCPTNTLLVSVRSGAAMSMPGMMTTFLNVGINEEIVEGLIDQTGQAWFAWDNYRRFIQSWGMSFGMPRDAFDEIMRFYKKKCGVTYKREFSPEQIRTVARAYRDELRKNGVDLTDNPREQLFTSIRQVIESWYSPKAKTYRQIMGISDNWGTAVTVQTMIFGNLDTRSGAGVMFTHDPWTAEDIIDPNGDFTLGNQGEDVVGGLVKTLPISEKQRLKEVEPREASLEMLFPRIYRRLVEIAEKLVYEQHWGPQEIEFTFQGDSEDSLYILQSRNMSPRIHRRYRVFVPTPDLEASYLASGIGVSGGALCGRVAFDVESIEELRRTYPNDYIILIRSDTVPDDIKEISLADGILTGKGGATSHAAIVAHRLGKTCVVGCSKMTVWESQRRCEINGYQIKTGDILGLDGRSGAIYKGFHETRWMDVETSE